MEFKRREVPRQPRRREAGGEDEEFDREELGGASARGGELGGRERAERARVTRRLERSRRRREQLLALLARRALVLE